MAKTHDDFVSRITELLKDGALKISASEIPNYLQAAIRDRYSADRPLHKINDKNGDGTYTYTLPTDWERGFSTIKSIEYPQGYQDPVYLTPEDWIIYLDTDDTEKLRFVSLTPTTGNIIRTVYTVRHTLSKSPAVNSIPDCDFDAVCNLTVSICCRALANYYSQTVDSALSADVVSYRTKREEYEAQAKVYEKLYLDHITTTGDKASVIGEWDIRTLEDKEFLFHQERVR